MDLAFRQLVFVIENFISINFPTFRLAHCGILSSVKGFCFVITERFVVELTNEYAGAAAGYYQLIMRSWIILWHGFMDQKEGLTNGSTNIKGGGDKLLTKS